MEAFIVSAEKEEASPTSSEGRSEPSDGDEAAATAARGHAATRTRPVLREPSTNERSSRARPVLRKSRPSECPARSRPILCKPTSHVYLTAPTWHVYRTAARPRTDLRKPSDGATGATAPCWAKPATCNAHATTGNSTDAAATTSHCSSGPSNPSHERPKNVKSVQMLCVRLLIFVVGIA